MGRRVKNFSVAEDTGASAIEIPKVNTNQRPTGNRGQIVYNKTTNTFQAYIGTGGSAGWFNISTAAQEKTITVDTFQGDGTTTVFGAGSGNTLDGSTAATLSTVPTSATDMAIFIGGVYQVPDTNYTYSGGQITFGSAPPANNGVDSAHIIAVIHNLHKLGE